MSSGFASNFAEVIEDKTLAKLFPQEHAALVHAMSVEGTDLLQVAQGVENDEDLDVTQVSRDRVADLCRAFDWKYEGLQLYISYHDAENSGDRYDEVNGAYWGINGAYVLSEGAKELGASNFDRLFFVSFG